MKAKALKESLEYKQKSAWEVTGLNKKELNNYCKEYIQFISENKTEREVVENTKKLLSSQGFAEGLGNSFYMVNRGKNIAIVRVGKKPLSSGVRFIVSHVDSPRIDLKQNPLYEDTEIALFKTHYYGGIKKFQWVTRALALHGVVYLQDGKCVTLSIGEKLIDPVFFISDLLPHLAHKVQEDKKIVEAIPGEKLNVVVGSIPFETKDEVKDKVKLAILDYLYKNYGIHERDFLTAELELVPAGPARELGFDRSMIAGYGHDDRVCAFASLKAILDSENEEESLVVLFADKEEIGSEGNTGAKSFFLKQVIVKMFENKKEGISPLSIETCLANSKGISADVNGAMDPDWKEVHEESNAAKLGHGVCVTKFTGSRGKSGASDANAEYVSYVARVLDKAGVAWQTGELGKVDEGGGGTIAKFMTDLGMDIIDMGPALLSMHAPVECVSKVDAYMTYKAYKAFFEISL